MATRPISVAAKPLTPPTLSTVTVDPAGLLRVSSHDTGEPCFGKTGRNRFDDPNPDPASRYGTCYFGASLAVAVAETLLHDRTPVRGFFVVELAVIRSRFVIQFKGSPLILADLTGAGLRRLGGHAGLTGTSYYMRPQKWSLAIYNHPDLVDGFVYMSRHKNDEKAVVLFDRASPKIQMTAATPLASHPEFGQVATDLYVRSSYP